MSDNLPVPVRPTAPLSVAPNVGGNFNPGVLGPNPYTLLLGRARTPSTRRAYANNLKWFFRDVYQCEPDVAAVRTFLGLSEPEMKMLLAEYRQQMQADGDSPATMNLRLTAVRALVTVGNDMGLCPFGGKNLVYSAKARAYRDTRGPGLDNIMRMLALPDRATLRGKRDFALLRLLGDNALRRCEIGRLDVSDFQPQEKRINVLGKGQDDKEWITLYPATVAAITEYLAASGHREGALFRNCAFRASAKGQPLTDDGLYSIIRTYGTKIGLKVSPHKFRHFAITAALDKTGGDVRKVQKFSRHKRVETLLIYDDNRTDHQGEITMLLGELLDG